MDHVLVTGAAGFIGFHTCRQLLDAGYRVVGLDNINDYYDVELKIARLKELGIDTYSERKLVAGNKYENFRFIKVDLTDQQTISRLFAEEKFDYVINLAAQAGVRYSLVNPQAYIDSNVTGFLNILEGCRSNFVKHLVYASTSSVYGLNGTIPFSVKDPVEHPISLYSASKKSNELMAHAYSHLFGIPSTGLRFFSVYGPWGRPDMALFIFTKAIRAGEPIDVYNHGKMKRDFTYVDDIVKGIIQVMRQPAAPNPQWDPMHQDMDSSSAPYRIVNIGNQAPVELLDFIREIEANLGKEAIMNMLPMQPGDVPMNVADVTELVADYGYKPSTSVKSGVKSFIDWYLKFYTTHS